MSFSRVLLLAVSEKEKKDDFWLPHLKIVYYYVDTNALKYTATSKIYSTQHLGPGRNAIFSFSPLFPFVRLKKNRRWLENVNFIFPCYKQYVNTRELNKFHIFALPYSILFIYSCFE